MKIENEILYFAVMKRESFTKKDVQEYLNNKIKSRNFISMNIHQYLKTLILKGFIIQLPTHSNENHYRATKPAKTSKFYESKANLITENYE